MRKKKEKKENPSRADTQGSNTAESVTRNPQHSDDQTEKRVQTEIQSRRFFQL